MPTTDARLTRSAQRAADLFFEVDRRGCVTAINEAGLALLGVTEAEALGQPGDTAVHPEARAKVAAHLAACFHGTAEPGERFDVPITAAGGRTCWLSCRLHPLVDAAGQVVGAQLAAHDVTQHVEARATARREADRLRLLATVSADSGPFADRVRRALSLTAQMLGYDLGILSHIEGQAYTVLACHAPGTDLAPGAAFDLGQTYCDLTLQRGDLLEISHMRDSPDHTHPCYAAFGLEGYLGVPIRTARGVVGTLSFSSSRPAPPLAEADRDLVRLLALWAGAETEKQGAADDLARHGDRLRALLDAIALPGSFEDQTAAVLRTLGRLFGLRRGYLSKVVGAELVLVSAVRDGGPAPAPGTRFPLGASLVGRLEPGSVLALHDVHASAYAGDPLPRSLGIRAFIGTHVRSVPGETYALSFADAEPAAPFTEADLDLMRLAEQWVGGLIERAERARELAARSEHLAAVLRQAPVVLFAFDADGRMTLNDGQAAHAAGGDPSSVLGQSLLDLYADYPAIVRGARAVLGGQPATWQVEVDGLTYDVHATPTRDADGALSGGIGVGLDITEHILSQAQIREAEARFRSLSRATFEGIFFSENGVVIDANEQGARLFGYDSVLGVIGMAAGDMLDPASREMALQIIRENRTDPYEALCVRADGSRFWAEVCGRPVDHNGRSVRMTAIRDISKRKAAEAQTRFQASVLAQVSEAVVALGLDGRVTYWNDGAERLHGIAPEAALGRRFADLVTYAVPDAAAPADALPAAGQTGDLHYTHPDGSRRVVSVSSSALRDEADAECGLLAVARDVTEARAMAAQLRHQAEHDALTGLPNRVRFREAIQAAIGDGRPFATLFVDLDRFKGVNDTLGHDAGDRLLRAVSDRMRRAVADACGAGGTVARLGGDEFAVLAPGRPEDADALAAALLAALERPVDLGVREVSVSASIGVVGEGHGYGSPEALLRDADTAMYEAKHGGRARAARFDRPMHDAASLRFALEHDLRSAALGDQLRLLLQPIVELQTGRVAGFEALVRWQHPERGLLTPDQFIPLAEELGVVSDIDRWVLRQTCREVSGWHEAGGFLMVSVNCSDQTFVSEGLAAWAREQADACDLDSSRLMLELTERAIVETGAAQGALGELRAQGIQLCIDDFGAGYSSLGLLQSLPVDGLKIDRSFVRDLETSASGRAVVRAVVSLCDELDLRVVAEGIETEEQLAHLRAIGCRLGQGYLFSRPVPPADARRLLAAPPWLPAEPGEARYTIVPLLEAG